MSSIRRSVGERERESSLFPGRPSKQKRPPPRVVCGAGGTDGHSRRGELHGWRKNAFHRTRRVVVLRLK